MKRIAFVVSWFYKTFTPTSILVTIFHICTCDDVTLVNEKSIVKAMVVIRLSLTLGALSEGTIAMGIVRVAVRPSQIGFRIITFERKVRVWRYQREVIRICISKKNRQHNGQKKKYKRANNNLQNIHNIKLKITILKILLSMIP
jgi:hypothetical protein